ncbi:hypothetical protein [Massilia oculi]|uniref:hypothetical protein n=1 Tax=Massilia oculi TaxID=945844 RepID=UPI001AAEA5F2|nr:hypothetical protein [Massilia oculi]
MTLYAYEISPRPAELGGGWQLRLIKDGVEVGGGVFPLRDGSGNPMVAAFQEALYEALIWQKTR